jgi:hypothetical protein
MSMKLLGGFLALSMAAGCAAGFDDATQTQDEVKSPDLAPSGRGVGTTEKFAHGGGAGPRSQNGISYHGGDVLNDASGVNVYVIWYGSWANNTATTILPDFLSHLGGSAYFNINTTYKDGAGVAVTNAVHLLAQASTTAYLGASLSDAQIAQVVSDEINASALPLDANAVYFVLTSADVTASSGFCTNYCGWHTHTTVGGADIKYAFVGNPDRCPSSCAAQATGPNGNAGADGMASIIAHELEEAVTDPDLDAWYDRRGYENADKCAWTFGAEYTTSNGAKANMKLGTRDYLIQQNWVNAGGGFCALSH